MKWQIKVFDELTASEVYDILKLRCEIFIVEQQCHYPDVDGADRGAWQLFSYADDGGLAASMRILRPGVTYDALAMGRVAVAPQFRGRGLARAMMEHAIDFAANRLGERIIKIGAQVYLMDFYTSLGFRPISEEYPEDGIPHIDMTYEADEI
ncbi:MAG: GNAT family N-acetyltransferase [Cloacibacillus sp.]